MDKTYRTEFRRVFLLSDLPAPLTRASEHLQVFDNYIENTRLRLRSIRAPHTKEWFWILEQRNQIQVNDLSGWLVSEIYLNEVEHQLFEHFEGREVRKNERVETNELRFNRYSFEASGKLINIDFFLNPLWGLCLANVSFQTEEEMKAFVTPGFFLTEVTQNENFLGRNLVGKTFVDVQKALENGKWKTENVKY
jgi:CYTH domain-containing protein